MDIGLSQPANFGLFSDFHNISCTLFEWDVWADVKESDVMRLQVCTDERSSS